MLEFRKSHYLIALLPKIKIKFRFCRKCLFPLQKYYSTCFVLCGGARIPKVQIAIVCNMLLHKCRGKNVSSNSGTQNAPHRIILQTRKQSQTITNISWALCAWNLWKWKKEIWKMVWRKYILVLMRQVGAGAKRGEGSIGNKVKSISKDNFPIFIFNKVGSKKC